MTLTLCLMEHLSFPWRPARTRVGKASKVMACFPLKDLNSYPSSGPVGRVLMPRAGCWTARDGDPELCLYLDLGFLGLSCHNRFLWP